MAGLLHDLGKPILSINFPKEYGEVQAAAKDRNISLWEAEREKFGTTHSEVGAYLIGLWGLPDNVVEALAFHHEPGKYQGLGFTPLSAVHVANVIEYQENNSGGEAVIPQIAPDYLAKFDMANRLPVWREICHRVSQEGKTDE
jgi:HD-like signal output (HDOD) protein